jgi:hypothetical protein
MIKLNNCNQINQNHVGMYARLGGRGILDGLSIPPKKFDLHLIKSIDGSGICLGIYHKKYGGVLPIHNFNQAVELYTSNEYKKMPVYS